MEGYLINNLATLIELTYPVETATGRDELVENVRRNAKHRRRSQDESQRLRPARVLKVRIEHVVVAQEGEDADDEQEHGTNVLPTEPPENTGTMAKHLFDVVGEVVDAVEPEDTCRFDKDHKQDGQSRPVNVQELD